MNSNILPTVSSVELKEQTNNMSPFFLLTIIFNSNITEPIHVISTNEDGLYYSIEAGANNSSTITNNILTFMVDNSNLVQEIGQTFTVIDNVSSTEVGKSTPFTGVVKDAGTGDI